MCGVAGILARGSEVAELPRVVGKMAERMAHRGPDDSGIWSSPTESVCLGHRRLSILDLSETGRQPMKSFSGRFVITFNGELYNFPELRKELVSYGHSFRGTSDTEVLLSAFDRWGPHEALERFVGMFAFGVWDAHERELILVRDRMGEKPLYYGWVGGDFVFASELKAFREHPGWRGDISREALALYLRHSYVPQPMSIYGDVKKLLPGSSIRVSADVTPGTWPEPVAYWSALAAAKRGIEDPLPADGEQIVETLDQLLGDAVTGQMVSDAPLGAFLSGGIDSSLIVAAMQRASPTPVRTFTIGFDDKEHDESSQAAAFARRIGTDHTEAIVTPEMALAVIPDLPSIYDEPFADSSQVPTVILSRLAAVDVKVCLTGDGADESFGGYGRYLSADAGHRRLRPLPPFLRRSAANGIDLFGKLLWDPVGGPLAGTVLGTSARLAIGDRMMKGAEVLRSVEEGALYQTFMAHHWRRGSKAASAVALDERAGPLGRWLDGGCYQQRMMFRDVMEYLPDDVLTKVDRASMSASLETRAPFLDHRIVEFAWRIPHALKISGAVGKVVLRQLLGRLVPAELIRPDKRGFTVPVGDWVKGPLREWAESLLDERRLKTEGYLDSARVRRMWAQHLDGAHDFRHGIWDLLMFQAWLEAQRR